MSRLVFCFLACIGAGFLLQSVTSLVVVNYCYADAAGIVITHPDRCYVRNAQGSWDRKPWLRALSPMLLP